MATVTPNPSLDEQSSFPGAGAPGWPRGAASSVADPSRPAADSLQDSLPEDGSNGRPSHRDALQALLAFSALHEQLRRRKALAARHNGFDAALPAEDKSAEFETEERFVLDDVLQLVAERAVAITGADGLAIALAENDEIVLRASAGVVRPDVGARIDRDSAFSGASFRTAQVVNCDDTETDPRVNLQSCRRLGARSMVAVPLCGRRRVIGLLEAFSTWPFSFNDSDVRNLTLLAELVVGALRPEDEDRFAQSAAAAEVKLQTNLPAVESAATGATPGPADLVETAPLTAAAPPAPIETRPTVAEIPATLPAAAVDFPVKEAEESAAVEPATLPAASQAAPKAAIPETAVSVETAVAEAAVIEIAPEAAPTFGQLQPSRPRSGLVALLISIVLAAAFAGGVWWKWKTAQLGGAMIQTQKPSVTSASPTSAASSAPQAGGAGGTSAAAATDMTAEANEVVTPATPQELTKFPRVTGIRHWSSSDSSTVVLDLEDQVQYEAHRLTSPDRIYFDLHDTQLAPELAGKSIDIGDALLSRVRVAQPVAGMTRVVLETKTDSNFSVSLEPNPYRLVVEVRKIGVSPKGAVNLFPNQQAEKNKLAIVIPPPTREDLQLRARVPKLRIVVDAGHGGWDLGTVGRRGLLEKDLVLEIAERLGKLLSSRLGADVIYTRQDDTYIPLDERAEIANQAQADLFVSVHANYSDLPSARGVETYYTNSFSAPGSKEAKDADARMNPPGTLPAVTPTLSAADLHERIEQSRRLAASVQRSLYGTLAVQNPGLRDRGVKEAGFVVLTESAMPGILAEVSFVSSPTDEQKLRSDGYREQIAEALYRGIARYAASSHNMKVASAK